MPSVLTVPSARRRPTAIVALATGAVLVLGACGGSPTDPTPVAPVTQAPVIEAAKIAPPAPVVPPRWPLTGVAATEVAVRPALAIKVENSGEARPQTGLDQADVVWEQVVEGGISRFVAVYQSQVPAEVGPIRSVRPMDPAIAAPLHGLIAFSGGQQQFVQALKNAGLQTISMDAGADGLLPQEGGRSGAAQRVRDAADLLGPGRRRATPRLPPTQFVIAKSPEKASAVVAGGPSSTVAVRLSGYSRPTWTWDAGTATWLRAEGSAPAMLRSGARIAATNVVTLKVRAGGLGHDRPGRQPGPGDGAGRARATPRVSSGGKTVTGTWTKTGDRRGAHARDGRRFGADARARDHVGRAGPGGLGLGHHQLRTARLPARGRGGVAAWSGPGERRGNAMTTTTRRGARSAVAAVLAAAGPGGRRLRLARRSPRRSRPRPVTQGPTIAPDKAPAPAPVVPPTWPLTGVAGEPAPAARARGEDREHGRGTAADRSRAGGRRLGDHRRVRRVRGSSRCSTRRCRRRSGPIRSVRPMDPVILAPMHGLLAFSGGQPGILDLVAASGVQMISHDAGAPGMYRVKDRAGAAQRLRHPDDVLEPGRRRPPGVAGGAVHVRPQRRPAAAAVAAGTPGGHARVPTSRRRPARRWTWDAGSGRVAAVGGRDARDGAQRRAAVRGQRRLDHRRPPEHRLRRAGRRARADLHAGRRRATGVVATGGKTVPVRWKKDADDAPMRLFTADGAPARPRAGQHVGRAGAGRHGVADDRLTDRLSAHGMTPVRRLATPGRDGRRPAGRCAAAARGRRLDA